MIISNLKNRSKPGISSAKQGDKWCRKNFSVRDLRIFEKVRGVFSAVNDFTVERDEADPCKARLCWEAVPDAQGYIVRHGIAGDKLYNNFQVMGENTLEIGSLNKGVIYYFTIDAYNERYYSDFPDKSLPLINRLLFTSSAFPQTSGYCRSHGA